MKMAKIRNFGLLPNFEHFLSDRKRTTVLIVHYGARTRRALVNSKTLLHEGEGD